MRFLAKKKQEKYKRKHTNNVIIPISLCIKLSLSTPLGLSSNRRRSLSLFLSSAAPASTPTAKYHPAITRNLPSTPYIAEEIQAKKNRAVPTPASSARHLPTPFPATTGSHFRRNHDQTNRLDVLYTKVLTFSPFVVLEKTHHLLFIFFFMQKYPGYCL